MSPCTTSMRSIGMPSSDDAIIDHDVSWPCPWGEVPVNTVAAPSVWICTRATSCGSPSVTDLPVIST